MSNTTTITPDMLTKLYERIDRIESLLTALVAQLPKRANDSEKWWENAHKKGLKAKEKGEFVTLSSKEDIEMFFNQL